MPTLLQVLLDGERRLLARGIALVHEQRERERLSRARPCSMPLVIGVATRPARAATVRNPGGTPAPAARRRRTRESTIGNRATRQVGGALQHAVHDRLAVDGEVERLPDERRLEHGARLVESHVHVLDDRIPDDVTACARSTLGRLAGSIGTMSSSPARNCATCAFTSGTMRKMTWSSAGAVPW